MTKKTKYYEEKLINMEYFLQTFLSYKMRGDFILPDMQWFVHEYRQHVHFVKQIELFKLHPWIHVLKSWYTHFLVKILKHFHSSFFTNNRKLNSNGNLIDRGNNAYDQNIPNKFITKVTRRDAESAVLKVTPGTIQNGGQVAVAWSNVEEPNEKDFVSLYCPKDDNPKHYLDFFNVNEWPTWKQGFGEKIVKVFNMRTDCVFKYFRYKDADTAQLAATSNLLTFSDGGPLAILQIHLAMTGDPTEMRVMWVSGKGKHFVRDR